MRLISDEKAKDMLKNHRSDFTTEYDCRTAIACIDAVPSAQPEQRWIPCSERLPKEDVEVLVTDDAGGMVTIDVDRCGRYEDTGERFWYTSQHVTAWMPLPECYQDKRKGADE